MLKSVSYCQNLTDLTVKVTPSHGSHKTKVTNMEVGYMNDPSLDPFLTYPFYLLPSQVHPTGFSFCFLPGFLANFVFLLSNNKNRGEPSNRHIFFSVALKESFQ